MFSFRCPECNAKMRAPKEIAGQTRKCPRCKHRFEVKLPPPQDEAPALVIDVSEFDLDLSIKD